MKYLVFLNRFDLNLNKLKTKLNFNKYIEEKNQVLIESDLDLQEAIKLQEISKIATIVRDYKNFDFKTLQKECLETIKKLKLKSYKIEIKFHDKIPISSSSVYKHINPYLKYENYEFSEDPDLYFYLEIKKEDNNKFYRLSYSLKKYWNKVNLVKVNLNNFYIVLENPELPEELSDFLRLCFIFKLPLRILTNDVKNFEKVLKKAKTITKGINYTDFDLKIIPFLSKDFIKVGFTKHASMNEKDLKNFFKENKDYKMCLIFGNDKFGLTQEVRDDLDYSFRLTPELKKPLKASHALSYVLGFYINENLL